MAIAFKYRHTEDTERSTWMTQKRTRMFCIQDMYHLKRSMNDQKENMTSKGRLIKKIRKGQTRPWTLLRDQR
jgi:hypothetical protein